MEINEEEHNKIVVGNGKNGFITSQTVEANLLYAILEKLEEVRCGLIDIENIVKHDEN